MQSAKLFNTVYALRVCHTQQQKLQFFFEFAFKTKYDYFYGNMRYAARLYNTHRIKSLHIITLALFFNFDHTLCYIYIFFIIIFVLGRVQMVPSHKCAFKMHIINLKNMLCI